MPTRELMRFALTGVANTAVGLAAITFAQTILSLGPYLSNAFGYGVGLACSYALNSRWTFRAGAGSAARPARFVVAFALAYGANLAVLHGLLTAGTPWLYAQLAALATYSALFFVLCKFVVFRLPAAPEPAAAPRK
jgi:putative flippase GtrA